MNSGVSKGLISKLYSTFNKCDMEGRGNYMQIQEELQISFPSSTRHILIYGTCGLDKL